MINKDGYGQHKTFQRAADSMPACFSDNVKMVVELRRIDINRQHRNTRIETCATSSTKTLTWTGPAAFSCEKPRTNIYITQAFNVHLYFFVSCIFCFCFVCMLVTSVRLRSPSWDTPNLEANNITVDDRSMVHDRAKTCLGCTYNIHKLMHLQGVSRELQ